MTETVYSRKPEPPGSEPALREEIQGRPAPRGWWGFALVMLATAAWATGGVFISYIKSGSEISSEALAFWRVFFTSLCLLGGLLVLRPSLLRVNRRDLPWLAGMGALAMATFQVLWIEGLQRNGLSLATVIQCNAPVFVTIMAWVIWREPLTWRKWAAIGLALAGTVLIARPTAGAGTIQITAAGLLVSLASAFAYGCITLFAKKLSGRYNAWTTLVYAFAFAALALLPFQIGRPLPSSVSSQAIAGFLGLVLVTTIAGYSLYYTGLRRLQASVAAIVAMTEVPFAALFGYIFLGERMDATQIIGSLAVVSGVLLLSIRAREQPEADAASGQASAVTES